MASDDPMTDTDPLLSTSDVIEQARRPLVIARHRDSVAKVERQITDEMLSTADGRRADDLVVRIADDELYYSRQLGDVLYEQLCLDLEYGEIDENGIGPRILAILANVRARLMAHNHLACSLEDAKSITCGRLGRLLRPADNVTFGSLDLVDGIVVSETQAGEVLSRVKTLARGRGGDPIWHEAGGDPPLSRELEEPLEILPDNQRAEARAKLVADRVRHNFFINVFFRYFDRDTLDPSEISAHPNVLHWLNSIEETPHLYPFMQGQTDTQKLYRLSQLWRKIVQMNELYQRVAQASDHPTYRDRFEDLDTRKRLAILAKERYPARKVDHTFSIATALCPFEKFAEWVQEKVTAKDFVLPPEPKR